MSSAATFTSRSRLPNRRESTVENLQFNGERYHISYSEDAGGIREVFITGPRPGSDLYAICCTAATLLSIAFQYGVPIQVLRESTLRDREGNPQEIMGAVLDVLCSVGAETPSPPG